MKSQGGGLSKGENQYIFTEENNIPEDLISEVLLRLPPNSVIQFKCVCKQWYSLISNPNFLQSYSVNQFHSHRHGRLYNNYIHTDDDDILIPRVCTVQPTTFLVLPQNHQTDDNEAEETEDLDHLQSSSPSMTLHRNLLNQSLIAISSQYSNAKDYVGTNLIDSCNGLLLYYTSHQLGCDKQCSYFLCNPITKHFTKLPSIKSEKVKRPDSLNNFFCPRIAFDPFLSLTYKVFMWIGPAGSSSLNHHHEFYVYSSETHSWKYLTSLTACGLYSYPFLAKTILLNGVLYWSYHYTDGGVSLCIDVDKESVWFLSLPPKPIGMNRLCLYFGECGGHLRLIERYSVDNGNYWMNKCFFPCNFDIMELNNNQQLQQQKGTGHNNTWTVKYRVRMDISSCDRLFRNNSYPEFAKVLHLYETKNKQGAEREEEMLLSTDNGCLISFNLDRKTFGRKIITDAHVCYDLRIKLKEGGIIFFESRCSDDVLIELKYFRSCGRN